MKNALILGDGPEERAWAIAISKSEGGRVAAAWPGWPDLEIPAPADLDDALATPGIDFVVIGGLPDDRAERLRRAAAEGCAVVCLHPPGVDSEAYYQVALSRSETGALIVPDLPARLHPGVAALRSAMGRDDLGTFRNLRYEAVVDASRGDLARQAFSRAVDVIRSLLGEIEAISGTGDPPGARPESELVAQLRGSQSRRAEVRLSVGEPGPIRITFQGALGALTLECPADFTGPARLSSSGQRASSHERELPDFDPREAILQALRDARAGLPHHPDLLDATRATEITEGLVRGLRKGRTIELHYENISEESLFKSVMTSFGCLIIISILIILPLALAGPALGLPWMIYLAYLIPLVLILFAFGQLFRFALRGPGEALRREAASTKPEPLDPA